MMRVALGLVLVACLGISAAHGETTLHLGETATIMAAPDELVGALRIEAVSASAADAQSRVNALVKAALAQASAVTAVTASTGGYGVWRTEPNAERWRASQSIGVSSRDGAAVLTLVGELQQKGFTVAGLSWRLSREAERKARQVATRQALSALRGRAEEAAELLELRFLQFKDVRLDSAQPQPSFRASMPMAMASAAAPPPSAVAEDVAVNATVEADAILTAR
jgi:predicted secreted protein